MRVFVVDNGGQWTHREWRVLKYIGVETKIVPNTTPFSEVEAVDGLVLSGGAPRVGLADALGACGDYLEEARFPILGICAGHQFMAKHYGGAAAPGKMPEFGATKVRRLVDDDTILAGVPATFTAWESHNDEVSVLPKDFLNLAESDGCAVQAMRHRHLPRYGLQFHPEVEHTEHGERIFRNFVDLCKR
ncbi:MAG: GMP synthase subunit A [Methanobacteriota archaeon]